MVTTADRRPARAIWNAAPGQEYRVQESGDRMYLYLGYAQLGSVESKSVWRVARLDWTYGLSILWADGNDRYDNIWSNYLSLTYL